jgi:cobalt-zinc-cadmium efflux system membrane fusion protein
MMRILKMVVGVVIALGLAVGFAVFVLQINPFRSRLVAKQAPSSRELVQIELVDGKEYTVRIPEAVGRALGIRQNDGDVVATAVPPRQPRPLLMPGSTALDPARIMRIRARFTPAQVVSVTEVEDKEKPVESMKTEKHELRPGDEVTPNMELGVFFSPEVGNKKNDLFEAIVQLRLDEVILKKALAAGGSLPDIYLWTARRNVDTDRSAVRRARNTLLTWGVAPEDIKAVADEASRLSIADGKREDLKEDEWTDNHDKWASIVLKAPDFVKGPSPAILVERNVSKGEIVVDNTVNLFTLARIDQMLVYANCPEDDLPEFDRLRKAGQLKWRVRTVGAEADGVEGTITEIGVIIDPNQHTAVIKGFVPNPSGKIRAGQFANATVELLAPQGVVEIPMNAVVEDGRQSIVFVQTNEKEHEYVMRRVEVMNRFEKTVFVRSTPFPTSNEMKEEERNQVELERKQGLLPKTPLKKDDVVLTNGVMELKAHVIEKEASRRSKK